MKSRIALAVIVGCAAGAASAQQPSSAFARGNSQQSWQNPGLAAVLEKCSKKPQPFRISGDGDASTAVAPPPPALPTPAAIPGVIAANQSWKVVWAWEGNNADGPIAGADGKLLFANQDASNVMELDPATGLAKILHENTNTGGALSRSKNGALFVASRGLGAGILQLEPQRKVLANSVGGEPLDCVGGVANDLTADSRGGVYLAVSAGGLFYANPQGVMTKYGDGVVGRQRHHPERRRAHAVRHERPDAGRVRRASRRLADEPARVRASCAAAKAATARPSTPKAESTSPPAARPTCSRRAASSWARSTVPTACTAWPSVAATRRRCTASSSTAAGARRARATRSSAFR